MLRGKITENWAFEFGFNRMISSDEWFSLAFGYRKKGPHRGWSSRIYISKFGFECNVYDIRH